MNPSPDTPEAFPHRPHWLVAIATVVAFLLLDHVHLDLFREVAGGWQGYPRVAALAVLGYGGNLLVPLLVAAALFGARNALPALGLNQSLLTGIAVGVAVTAVLLVGFALTASFVPPVDPGPTALRGAVLPGIGEEILYRAFLFGLLFRFAGWGFLPAALINAVLFGAAHLYQGNALIEAAGIFAITAVGAVWFSWLYVEWRYNVWVPAMIHLLMNLYWEFFEIGDTALGTGAANALRFAAIAISIVLTLRFARRHGGRIVRGRRWWRGEAVRETSPPG